MATRDLIPLGDGGKIGPSSPLYPYPDHLDLRTNPCLGGHVVTEDVVEYYDGVIVANCSACGDRILLSSVPGGVSFLRIKTLLGAVMGLNGDKPVPGFDLATILSQLNELKEALEEDKFAVEQAERLINLAATILEQKVKSQIV